MNIAVKWPYITELPKYCDECPYYETRPHPMRGWTDSCSLCSQCLDCEESDDGWHYDGNKRPDNCPLVDLDKDNEYCSKVQQPEDTEDTEDVRDIDFKTYDGIVSAILQRIYECSSSQIDSDDFMTNCEACPLSAHLKSETCTYMPDLCRLALDLKRGILK